MIYHVLGILVFFIFVAALIGFILFTFVIIDVIVIWWGESKNHVSNPREIPDLPCSDTESHLWHFWSDGQVGYECPGVPYHGR